MYYSNCFHFWPVHCCPVGNEDRGSGRNGGIFSLIKAVYAEMGYESVFSVMPPERALQDVNSGAFDAHIGSTLNLLGSYTNFVYTKEVIVTVTIQGWAKKGSSIVIKVPDDLKKFTIGQIRGAKGTESLVANLKLTAEATNTIEQLARMLDSGRFDIALVPSVLPTAILENVGILIAPKLYVTETFHIFNKKHTNLIEKWDTVLKAMKADGRYQKLVSGK